LGTLASYLPGQLVGGAFRAQYILCKTEDIASETPVEEDNYVAALEFAESNGADVATSSLSYSDWYTQADMNGVTAVTSIAVNIAASHGMHCCTAAGNAGHDDDPTTSRLGAPADGLRVLTCGSVNFEGLLSSFSSDGPSADGRTKPELLARGRNTITIAYDNTTDFVAASGTSLSTPLLAGAVACLTQAHPTWTPDQMRQALMSTASRANNPDPLFAEGYGIVNAAAAAAVIFCGTADFNNDGDYGTDADIEAFFACLAGTCCPACGTSDFNADGDFGTDQDIEAFFRVLAGGNC
jgi:serine protease AprX